LEVSQYNSRVRDCSVLICLILFMVFNATFKNISVISWWSVLLVEETGENHQPVVSHWQTLSHNVVSSVNARSYSFIIKTIKVSKIVLTLVIVCGISKRHWNYDIIFFPFGNKLRIRENMCSIGWKTCVILVRKLIWWEQVIIFSLRNTVSPNAQFFRHNISRQKTLCEISIFYIYLY
jgi:hypothetical protein